MKKLLFLLLFTTLTDIALSQKKPVPAFATVDSLALKVPDSLTGNTSAIAGYINACFKTDIDKTRAIFIWLAGNIQYDVENMFAIDFYSTAEERIGKTLKTRKGICENYAAIFADICLKCGIKAFVIEGYTKQNGFADYIPHAWNAAYIDTAWFLFDPTWGSGYVNGGKFYKKINNYYFKSAPGVFIKSHMPFDYLWQFLYYPISNQEFTEGKTLQVNTRPFFNYADSIREYEKQGHIAQLTSSSYRIEKNGVKNSLVFDRLRHIKMEIENEKQNKNITLYNSAVALYNESSNSLNAFIQYRNKQFTPSKSDPEIQKMLDTVAATLKEAKDKLGQISDPDISTGPMISQFKKSINDISAYLKEQQDWLTLYFSKGKSKRKSMFYEKKVSLFGIPLN